MSDKVKNRVEDTLDFANDALMFIALVLYLGAVAYPLVDYWGQGTFIITAIALAVVGMIGLTVQGKLARDRRERERAASEWRFYENIYKADQALRDAALSLGHTDLAEKARARMAEFEAKYGKPETQHADPDHVRILP